MRELTLGGRQPPITLNTLPPSPSSEYYTLGWWDSLSPLEWLQVQVTVRIRAQYEERYGN